MDIDELCRHPEYRNYVCCYHGLAYAGIKLEAYTREGLKSIHKDVYRKLAGKQPCTQRCSEVYGREISSWCDTCRAWKRHLCNASKLKDINFGKMISWDWTTSYESIAPYFLPQSWPCQNFQDISTSCHIWNNCKNMFTIRHHVLKTLRECRNTYFAHNPRLRVTDLDKSKVFDALKDLFKDPDVMLHIDAQNCLSELDRIEKGDLLSNSLKSIFEALSRHSDDIVLLQNIAGRVMESQNNLITSVRGIEQKQNEMERHLQEYHERVIRMIMAKEENIGNKKRNGIILSVFYMAIFIAMFGIVLQFGFNYMYYGFKDKRKVNDSSSYKDCLSEEYTYPFKQDLPLLEYIYDSEPIIGREWLYEMMESKLISSNSTFKGVAMIADMGYGKSSFVSHILCAKEREKSYAIKSHVVAFHICKFDVKSTQSPARFIRRLIGFLATRYEEYGNIISIMSGDNIMYNQEFCENDPVACFDQSIIFPFRQLSFDSNFPWILIIDALDECYEKSSGKNLILDLLIKRVRELPEWFKVFVTSRYISELYLLKRFEHAYLKPTDPRNIKDVKEYIHVKYLSLGFENNEREIGKLIKLCDGNFLFLVHAIRFRLANHNIKSLPDSLEEIYELNFDRQYDDTDSFLPSKAIFEIVLASFNLLSKEEIFHILESNNITDKVQFRTHMNKLSFFLRNEHFVTIFHKSLYQWLINSGNKKYSISLKAGHAYISFFLFNEISNKREVDIADLSIHVSEALNDTLNQMFLALDMNNLNQSHVNEALHNLIRKTEGINALALLIKHNLDVNTLHEGQSPSFISALKGNIGQLLFLLNNGANVSFVLKSNYAVYSRGISKTIKDIKQSRCFGYGLIHIAAKHGHEKIVSKLLEYNKDMIYWKTSLGQRPSDIACEMGNLNVLQTFPNLDNDMLSDCIYYAARSGNVNIILSLIERKLYLSCISDEQSRDAFKEMEIKNPKNIVVKDNYDIKMFSHSHFIYPLDKWWIVKKQTPIHAAILSGSTEVAKLLIKFFPGLLDCTDLFGYTVTLLSVVENEFDLLPLLTDHISTDRCNPYYCDTIHFRDDLLTGLYHTVDSRSTNYTSSFVERYFCENGSSFMDLSIKYKRHEFMKYAIEENIITDLNSANEEGIYLIHIAARDANTFFIDFAIKDLRLDISSIKCKNGSTAYHIAAITPSIPSLFRMTNGFTEVIPDIKDINERGFLHHTCLFDQNLQNPIRSHEHVMNLQTSSFECFEYFVEVCNINIQSTDVFGRNILHYALVNGQFSIIEYITINYPLEFRKLLNQNDVNTQTPVQYALAKVNAIMLMGNEKGVHVYFAPPQSHLDFLDQFKSCFSKEPPCIFLKKAWEISFMFTIRELKWEEFQTVIGPFLYLFFNKSRHVFHFIWTFYTQLTDDVLRALIIKSIDEKMKESRRTLEEIALYRPTVFSTCGLPFKRSPLHYIALKGSYVVVSFVVEQLRVKNSSFNGFNCADENGRLVFHYTLMIGELQQALFQLDNNMWNRSNEIIVDAILITILLDQKRYEVCWNENSICKKNEEYKTDMLLSRVIKLYKDILQITDFCKNNSKRLSVVHLLSVSVMKNTIKTLVEIYGRDILNCMTTDRITPMYLWKLFSPAEHDEIIDESLEILQPKIYAEKFILSNIMSSLGYKHIPKSATYCIFKPGPRQNKMYISQLLKDYECIYKTFSHGYYREECTSTRSLIKLLRLVFFTDIKSVERCLYISKLFQAMGTMIKDISTCFMFVAFKSQSYSHVYVSNTRNKLSYQISKLTVDLENCLNDRIDKLQVSKRLKFLMFSIRNFLIFTLKRQREHYLLQQYEDTLFDMGFYEVISNKGYDFLLLKISKLKTKQLAMEISKRSWRFDHLNVLMKTSGYKTLKNHLEKRYVHN